MTLRFVVRGAMLATLGGLAAHASADSFASSASSAGSASSGSVSDSLKGSSNSSTGDKNAAAHYRIIDVAQTPERAGSARLTMQADDPQQRIVLDLPQAVVDKEKLVQGSLVHAQPRAYGLEFARSDTRATFFLVLADDWYGEMAARPVSL